MSWWPRLMERSSINTPRPGPPPYLAHRPPLTAHRPPPPPSLPLARRRRRSCRARLTVCQLFNVCTARPGCLPPCSALQVQELLGRIEAGGILPPLVVLQVRHTTSPRLPPRVPPCLPPCASNCTRVSLPRSSAAGSVPAAPESCLPARPVPALPAHRPPCRFRCRHRCCPAPSAGAVPQPALPPLAPISPARRCCPATRTSAFRWSRITWRASCRRTAGAWLVGGRRTANPAQKAARAAAQQGGCLGSGRQRQACAALPFVHACRRRRRTLRAGASARTPRRRRGCGRRWTRRARAWSGCRRSRWSSSPAATRRPTRRWSCPRVGARVLHRVRACHAWSSSPAATNMRMRRWSCHPVGVAGSSQARLPGSCCAGEALTWQAAPQPSLLVALHSSAATRSILPPSHHPRQSTFCAGTRTTCARWATATPPARCAPASSARRRSCGAATARRRRTRCAGGEGRSGGWRGSAGRQCTWPRCRRGGEAAAGGAAPGSPVSEAAARGAAPGQVSHGSPVTSPARPLVSLLLALHRPHAGRGRQAAAPCLLPTRPRLTPPRPHHLSRPTCLALRTRSSSSCGRRLTASALWPSTLARCAACQWVFYWSAGAGSAGWRGCARGMLSEHCGRVWWLVIQGAYGCSADEAACAWPDPFPARRSARARRACSTTRACRQAPAEARGCGAGRPCCPCCLQCSLG